MHDLTPSTSGPPSGVSKQQNAAAPPSGGAQQQQGLGQHSRADDARSSAAEQPPQQQLQQLHTGSKLATAYSEGSGPTDRELSAADAARSPHNLQPAGFRTMSAGELAKEVHQLQWVGHGGYGAVYKGVWQGANVAVKFTVAEFLDVEGATAHEAVLSKILSHPNVVQVRRRGGGEERAGGRITPRSSVAGRWRGEEGWAGRGRGGWPRALCSGLLPGTSLGRERLG